MCKSPAPDTSPEARHRADEFFAAKRKEQQRKRGQEGWPFFAALRRDRRGPEPDGRDRRHIIHSPGPGWRRTLTAVVRPLRPSPPS